MKIQISFEFSLKTRSAYNKDKLVLCLEKKSYMYLMKIKTSFVQKKKKKI